MTADETLWYAVAAPVFPLDRVGNACGRAKTWVDRGLSGLIGAVGLRIALG